jgi:hypothetical protein
LVLSKWHETRCGDGPDSSENGNQSGFCLKIGLQLSSLSWLRTNPVFSVTELFQIAGAA